MEVLHRCKKNRTIPAINNTRTDRIQIGGQSERSQVRDAKEGRPYVRKSIDLSALDSRAQQDAKNEVKVLAKLKHPSARIEVVAQRLRFS